MRPHITEPHLEAKPLTLSPPTPLAPSDEAAHVTWTRRMAVASLLGLIVLGGGAGCLAYFVLFLHEMRRMLPRHG